MGSGVENEVETRIDKQSNLGIGGQDLQCMSADKCELLVYPFVLTLSMICVVVV